jgi:DNA-binding transcriptional regulator GbsR (MarR family)
VAERDPEVVGRFIEHFASALVEAGLPRMPARIFAALQATDSGRLTSAELAETLQVSPAAISGAVRYMAQFDMIRREREPGSRRDQYVVDGDTWYEVILQRDKVILRWLTSAQEGIAALGADTPAGARMVESQAFFQFLHQQMPLMLAEWQKVKAELNAAKAD